MPKYWDDDTKRYIDCDSINFTGPKAEYTLVDGDGFVQKYAPEVGDRQLGQYVTQQEIKQCKVGRPPGRPKKQREQAA